jgi:hypothetical protein
VASHIVSFGEADQYHVTWEATDLRVFVEQEARHFVFFSVSFFSVKPCFNNSRIYKSFWEVQKGNDCCLSRQT